MANCQCNACRSAIMMSLLRCEKGCYAIVGSKHSDNNIPLCRSQAMFRCMRFFMSPLHFPKRNGYYTVSPTSKSSKHTPLFVA